LELLVGHAAGLGKLRLAFADLAAALPDTVGDMHVNEVKFFASQPALHRGIGSRF
jgi:hypothetical protein